MVSVYMSDRKRNVNVDIIKGLLIISVIWGHSYWKYTKAIFWFHMPLFFIVSGFLLKIPSKSEEKSWLSHKIMRFMIPYFVYALISSLFLLNNGFICSVIQLLKCLYGGKIAGGVFWYINVLLISSFTIVLIENRINSKKVRLLIYSCMYILSIIESLVLIPKDSTMIPNFIKLPWDIDVCLIAVPYMAIGRTIKSNLEMFYYYFRIKKIQVPIFALSIGFILYLIFSNAIEWFRIDIKYTQYKNFILDLLCPLVFGIIIYCLSIVINKYLRGVILSYIGRRSMIIMYLHLLIRDALIIPLFGEKYPILLYVGVTIIICVIWDYFISRFPIISPFFGAVVKKD